MTLHLRAASRGRGGSPGRAGRDHRGSRRPLLAVLALSLAGLAIAPTPLGAAVGLLSYEEQNLGRGFGIDTDKLAVGQLDQVSLFNGNLTATIPIGPRYAVGGGLSYGFTLVYNSNVWDTLDTNCPTGENQCGFRERLVEAWPQLDSNAGIGWKLTLGELYPPRRFDSTEPVDKLAVNKSVRWAWIGPDGAKHLFDPTLHHEVVDENDPGHTTADTRDDQIFYTNDGSYLRMVVVPFVAGERRARIVEFPDGTEQRFEAFDPGVNLNDPLPDEDLRQWRLVKIYNQFSSDWVTVTYSPGMTDPATGALKWDTKVEDSQGRQQVLHFVQETVGVPDDDGIVHPRLESVDLTAFGGTTATYDFVYGTGELQRDPAHTSNQVSSLMTVRVLREIVLPDGTSFADPRPDHHGFEYTDIDDDGVFNQSVSGRLDRMVLPTGGVVEWDYGIDFFPKDQQCKTPGGFIPDVEPTPQRLTRVTGVRARRELKDVDATDPSAVWTYQRSFSLASQLSVECPTGTLPISPEMVVTVTDPLGNQSEHFFSAFVQTNTLSEPVAPGFHTDYPTTEGWRRQEYGLPFTRQAGTALEDEGVFLSTRVYEGPVASANLLRSTYVAYDMDPGAVGNDCTLLAGSCGGGNPRVRKTVTLFGAKSGDEGNRIVEESTGFDGFGHYRVRTSRGLACEPNGAPSKPPGCFAEGSTLRTSTTAYTPNGNPVTETYTRTQEYLLSESDVDDRSITLPGASAPWLLNLYQSQRTEEGGQAVETRTCFDLATGFLSAERRLAGAGQLGQNDVLVERTADRSTGDLIRERVFGADLQDLPPSSAACGDPPAGAAAKRTDFAYQHGALSQSTIFDDSTNSPVLRLSLSEIDPNTGLPASTEDAADVLQTFAYDGLGRLVRSQTATDEPLQVRYDLGGSPPVVDIVRGSSFTSPLTRAHLELDGFGRVVLQQVDLPGMTGSQAATRSATYDALGRLRDTSVATKGRSTTAKKTQIERDALGRAKTVTAPDGTRTAWSYRGVREVQRTVDIDGVSSTTTGVLDPFGRAVSITEPSGVDGAPTTTHYLHDVGDRLARVTTTAGGVTQVRRSVYDALGFLRCTSDPELAGTATSCDAPDVGQDGEPGSIRYDDYDVFGNAGIARAAGIRVTQTFYDPAGRAVQLWDRTPVGGSPRNELLQESFYALNNTGTGASTDHRAGKLVLAKRHNRVGGRFTTIVESFRYQDRAGRMTSSTLRSTTGRRFRTGYEYDALGNVTQINYPSCLSPDCLASQDPLPQGVLFGYQKGLLTAVQQIDLTPPPTEEVIRDLAVGLTYHPSGLVSSVPHAGSVTESIAADPHGMARPGSISFGTLWSSDSFAWDGAGNVVTIGLDNYDYDRVGRLISGQVGGGSAVQSATYDAFGNLTNLAPGRLTTTMDTPPEEAVDHATNRLAAPVTYDALGRVTGGFLSIDSIHWDAFDRPIEIRGEANRSYLYDASGNRVATVDLVSGDQLWTPRGADSKVLREYEVTGPEDAPEARWKIDDYYRGSLLLASERADGARRHYYLDHLGSTRLVTTDGGAEVARYEYYPFGGIYAKSGSEADANRLLFTGHERDFNCLEGTCANPENDDLDYMLARSYSPVVGRFLSTDEVSGNVGNPQSWNRYSYSKNNPVNRLDPDGRDDDSQLQLLRAQVSNLSREQREGMLRRARETSTLSKEEVVADIAARQSPTWLLAAFDTAGIDFANPALWGDSDNTQALVEKGATALKIGNTILKFSFAGSAGRALASAGKATLALRSTGWLKSGLDVAPEEFAAGFERGLSFTKIGSQENFLETGWTVSHQTGINLGLFLKGATGESLVVHPGGAWTAGELAAFLTGRAVLFGGAAAATQSIPKVTLDCEQPEGCP